MAEVANRKCRGVDCPNDAGTLQCPTCLKSGTDSFFCSQDCFKRSWSEHKSIHKKSNILTNLFPPKRFFEASISAVRQTNGSQGDPTPGLCPRWYSPLEQKLIGRHNITILNKKEQEGMRKVCRLAREVLDAAARELKPGITTDYLDEVVHKACIERDSSPSPLNYMNFPKSVCTSVNETICHGIPDQRPLQDGDIVNIDVTLYHNGFHGDINETYYVGDKALANPDAVRVVETARECLDQSIDLVKPGMLFRDPGTVIEKLAKSRNCSVVKSYCGHGINQLFHCAPNIPHYAKNKAVGTAKPGMCFTIEPMINIGTHRDRTWPDDWTSTTQDGSLSAQFEHTLLVTEDGVEVLTARLADSPGGPVPMPSTA
ncbi:hypothetical protein PDIDSM_6519 [Penicillium digitatum]|nr:hypothetical protein PDIDSM_6519 [Penicillium digitatum]